MSTTAQTGARGIVASGRYGDYIFIKTQKFDAVGFQKALASAKTTAKDYNEGVDRAVTDYISGMSDEFATRLFEQWFVPQKWSVL